MLWSTLSGPARVTLAIEPDSPTGRRQEAGGQRQQPSAFSDLVKHKVRSWFAPPGDLSLYRFKSGRFPKFAPGDLIWVTLGQDTHCTIKHVGYFSPRNRCVFTEEKRLRQPA